MMEYQTIDKNGNIVEKGGLYKLKKVKHYVQKKM